MRLERSTAYPAGLLTYMLGLKLLGRYDKLGNSDAAKVSHDSTSYGAAMLMVIVFLIRLAIMTDGGC